MRKEGKEGQGREVIMATSPKKGEEDLHLGDVVPLRSVLHLRRSCRHGQAGCRHGHLAHTGHHLLPFFSHSLFSPSLSLGCDMTSICEPAIVGKLLQ
jgi:hypothetical protein